MKVSELLMMLLMVSGVASGLSVFYGSMASTYGISATQLDTIETTFNQYAVVDLHLKSMREAMSNLEFLNPLTWFNIVPFIVNIFLLLFDIPVLFFAIMSDMVIMSGGLIPVWAVWLIEAVVLLVIIFAALSVVTRWKV